jgi:uncharacterized protein YcbK (DUF882 family)
MRGMRQYGLVKVLACALVVASSAGALAQPRPHAKRTIAAATVLRPGESEAVAYRSGKQALSGLHATSSKPAQRDETGRPLLLLRAVNRGESLAMAAAHDDGGFASVDLDRAAHLLRASSGEEHPVDPRTLSLVYRIQTHFGMPEVCVISGYRVPKPGSHSNHGTGRAIDIVLPGVADEEVARFAREMGFVGVGVYPASRFVHVDIRARSYFWVDYSGPRMRNSERGILGDLAAKSDVAALARGQFPVEPFALATDVDGALRARGLGTTTAPFADDEEDDEN